MQQAPVEAQVITEVNKNSCPYWVYISSLNECVEFSFDISTAAKKLVLLIIFIIFFQESLTFRVH